MTIFEFIVGLVYHLLAAGCWFILMLIVSEEANRICRLLALHFWVLDREKEEEYEAKVKHLQQEVKRLEAVVDHERKKKK